MPEIAPAVRVLNQKPNPWNPMDPFVSKYHPLNLAQGSPDFLMMRQRALEHLRNIGQPNESPFLHQYTRASGHPRLVNALGKLLTERFRHDPSASGPVPANLRCHTFAADRCIDPMKEVFISVGSCGSLSTAFAALVNPGDEVVVIEPASFAYVAQIEAAGGVYVGVPMIPPPENTSTCYDSGEFAIDWTSLESAITKKTRVLVINSPNSATGKVFDAARELKRLADICVGHNLFCLADEAFEWLVFPPHKHHKIASFPGMWERTVTVGGAGTTLGLLGWKIGWSVGPSHLITAMQLIQQNTIYTVCTPIQEALARTIEDLLLPSLETSGGGPSSSSSSAFFGRCSADLAAKRDRIATAFANSSPQMRPIKSQAGFFMLVDISQTKGAGKPGFSVEKPLDDLEAFNDWIAANKDLVGFPVSPFFCRSFDGKFLQLCIASNDKDDATVDDLATMMTTK